MFINLPVRGHPGNKIVIPENTKTRRVIKQHQCGLLINHHGTDFFLLDYLSFFRA